MSRTPSTVPRAADTRSVDRQGVIAILDEALALIAKFPIPEEEDLASPSRSAKKRNEPRHFQ